MTAQPIDGGHKAVSLVLLAACEVAALGLWFSAAAVASDLRDVFALSTFEVALLQSAVQGGFVIGTLVSAVLGLADRIDPRRYFMVAALVAAAIAQLFRG